MVQRREVELADGRVVRLVFTDVEDGDFRVVDPVVDLEQRRRAVIDRPWSWLRQVHGARVLLVEAAGEHAGVEGDGLVTVVSGCPVSVTTADCGPLALVAERGVALVHAGWRGLLDGVVGAASSMLGDHAGRPVASVLGPTIGPGSYEFGDQDLARMASRFGSAVVGRTDRATPALDMAAAVAAACVDSGWPAPDRPPCTSDPQWFSHRTRSDRGRQAAVAWIEDAVPEGSPGG